MKIQGKAGEIAPLQLNRVQQHLIPRLTGHDIVLKARQVGISTGLQALNFYEQMQGNARTNTLCHEDDLTKTLRQMADLFYEELPSSVKPSRQYANAKQTTYDELHSSGNIATVGGAGGATSKRKGRGGSMTRIHASEVAFWPDAKSVLSAAMQAGNPAIVLESTPNGMAGHFYELCMEALNGDSVWTLHFYPWWWEDEYQIPLEDGETLTYNQNEQALIDEHGLTPEQIKWRRYKQKELKEEFFQEYPEDPYSCFLASGTSYFGDIEHALIAPLVTEPVPDREYLIGLDFGQSNDFTVGFVLDTVTLAQVDMLRVNKQSWGDIRQAIVDLSRKWNGARVIAEENSIGSVNIEALISDGVSMYSFATTPKSKPPLIQGLRYALADGGLTLLDLPVIRHEFRSFISKQLPSGAWQYMAQEGAHDDIVMAAALAWHGYNMPVKLVDFA